MKQQRLDGLADGIFAIVMTLLVFEIHVPFLKEDIAKGITDQMLWAGLMNLWGNFFTFLLSFALLFTYWRAHHFLTSVYARTLTVGLANYNALFFLLIALVPFSSRLLGEYWFSQVAIIVYGIHVILIGMTLFFMRRHIEKNPRIDTLIIHKDERVSGYVRIFFPAVCALVAIGVSFWNPGVSLIFFAFGILFNLLPASTNWIHNNIIEIVRDVE